MPSETVEVLIQALDEAHRKHLAAKSKADDAATLARFARGAVDEIVERLLAAAESK